MTNPLTIIFVSKVRSSVELVTCVILVFSCRHQDNPLPCSRACNMLMNAFQAQSVLSNMRGAGGFTDT